ncbi:MAG: hypothetical protein M1457_00840, partial [bacterium]|nr:hypothetical protein [bacterium]
VTARRRARRAAGGYASAEHRPGGPRLRPWARLMLGLVLVCTLVLAATGFIASLIWAQPLSGVMLLVHTCFGAAFAVGLAVAAFAVGLAVLVVGCSEPCRLTDADLSCCGNGGAASARPGGYARDRKIAFWGLVLFGFISTMTIRLCMMHLFGTDGQAALVAIHRYSALALLLTGIALGVNRMFVNTMKSA